MLSFSTVFKLKSRTSFERITSQSHRFWQSLNHWRSTSKKPQATVCRFLKCINFRAQRKDWESTIAHYLPEEIVSAIMRFYKNRIVIGHSPNGDTDFFVVVTGVLRVDKVAPSLFILRLDNVLQAFIDLMEENVFTLKKARRWFPAICKSFFSSSLKMVLSIIRGRQTGYISLWSDFCNVVPFSRSPEVSFF